MNKKYAYIMSALCLAPQLYGQGTVTIELDQSTLTLPIEDVDLMQSDTQTQQVNISFPVSRKLSTSEPVAADKVNLKNENAQSFNVLSTVTFLMSDNPDLLTDVSIDLGNLQSAKLVLPYLSNLSALKPIFSGTGAYVFVNDKLWNEGDKVNFTEPAVVKVVAFNGDVRTYQLTVTKTELPFIDLKSSVRSIDKDWVEGSMSIDGVAVYGMSIKGKGSHYSYGLKNNYAIKFDEKQSLLNITKNKRWLLLADESDNTSLRSHIGYWLAEQLADGAWTPTAKSVNLSVNGSFCGCYSLVEQPRICKGRFEDGFLLSVEQEADYSDDCFRSKRSNTLFVFEDPETGSKGTHLIRIKDKIDKFEKAMEAENWNEVENLADLKSFANWLVVNEIAANGDAFISDTYIHVDADGKICMLPAWNLKKAFGCESGENGVFVASQTPWMQHLLNNKSFVSLVKQQYAKVRQNEKELDAFISQQLQVLKDAAVANNAVWNNLDAEAYGSKAFNAFDNESERLRNWMTNRFKWLDTQW